jgi:hypothetical protein
MLDTASPAQQRQQARMCLVEPVLQEPLQVCFDLFAVLFAIPNISKSDWRRVPSGFKRLHLVALLGTQMVVSSKQLLPPTHPATGNLAQLLLHPDAAIAAAPGFAVGLC